MTGEIKFILILIILFITFIILNFYKSTNSIFDDIMIFGLWDDKGAQNEYEVTFQKKVEINVFNTINNTYKKIAPGSKGSFVIKFKRPINSNYKIIIEEKTKKPQNLIFMLDNKRYSSLEEIEEVINEKFINTEKITINWEWKYFINETYDIQDTKDGKNAQTYLFEIKAIVEEQERTEM